MPRVSVAQLFDDNAAGLGLAWAAGPEGGSYQLDSARIQASPQGLIGHLNSIHPNWIQVLSRTETAYLESLDSAARAALFERLRQSDLACLIVSDGEPVPQALRAFAAENGTAVLGTALPSLQLMWLLRPWLARALAESVSVHGVLLDVLDVGVLIVGESNVGKSELALELISRGSGLIADDVVELYRIAPNTIEGRCPPMLKDFLEIRGLGMINIRAVFGETAIRIRKNVKLVVELKRAGQLTNIERLPIEPATETLLEVKVRKFVLPVAAGRNLAVLVEAAVRHYVLERRGLDGTREFIRRQAEFLRQDDGD